MVKLIMTDLDCTLLPMDQDAYINRYVNEIAKLFFEHGYDGKAIAKATMQASYAMAKNDGSRTNAQVFEQAFASLVGDDAQTIIDIFPQVYGDRYNVIKEIVTENKYANEIVGQMRAHAEHIVVATQPMFPIEAVRKRLGFIGLSTDMFDYVTVYDNSTFCKPHIGYYQEIMDRFSATPSETVMIGNDITEDILPCEKLGIRTFLVTDNIINAQNHDITKFRQGTYTDLIEFLKSL